MTNITEEEVFRVIPEFPNYSIGSLGNVFNHRTDRLMRTSRTIFGYVKITLTDFEGRRFTRSVAQLVAEAFIIPPNALCDNVVVLDGDLSNLRAENLVWRPRWYAWQYRHQFGRPQPLHFQNLPVRNTQTQAVYSSVMDAGMAEGLLFIDIWRSTYTGDAIFPYEAVFEVIGERG
jgi:hypothetical protein